MGGVEVAWSGITPKNNCKSLRQYVAALNGLAQINAFRDKGILEGNEIWGALIKQLLTSMICLLINKLFYVTIVFAEMVLVLRMPMHLIWNSIRRKLQINVAICRRQPTPVLSQMLESIYVKEELVKM